MFLHPSHHQTFVPLLGPVGVELKNAASAVLVTRSATNSAKATQTLINQSQVMFTTTETGFDSSLANQKREYF